MGALELGLLSSQKRAIAKKLEEPTTAGTANQVLTSDGNGGQVWATVGSGTITVDPTLSVAGSAADAKATGAIKSDVYQTTTKTLTNSDITWSTGVYLKSDGTTASSAAYKISEYLPVSVGDSVVFDGLRSPSSVYPVICGYNGSKTAVSGSNVAGDGTTSQSGTYTVPSGVAFIRVSTYDYDGVLRFNSLTMPIIECRIDILDDEVDSLDDRLDAVEAAIPMYEYTLGFDDFEYETGKLATKDGEQTRTDGQVTDYISTENMLSVAATTVHMPVLTSDKVVAIIGCYDSSKNLIENKSAFATGTYGQFVDVTATVTITSDIKYVRLSRLKDSASTSIFTVTKERTLAADYDVTKEEIDDIQAELNPWNGKNWFVFGTSMSDDDYPNTENDNKPTGVFPKYLQAMSGMKQFNHGKAGGTISLGGPYSASGQIYTEITNTDFSSADIITLEGFFNDYAECIPLGEIGDSTQETFYGALYLCIKYLSEHNTTAAIVVITDPAGKEYTFQHGASTGITVDYSSTHKNAIGLYLMDYNDAVIKTCQWMGVHCIDVGGKSQINEYHPDYIVDQCHQTELGGKQFAMTVWEELKNIHCNDDVVVS